MSLRSSRKSKGHSGDTSWSEWTWDESRGKYYRSRYYRGNVEYYYQPESEAEQTPRTVPTTSSAASTGQGSPESSYGSNYGYQSQQSQDSVGMLTDSFSNATMNDPGTNSASSSVGSYGGYSYSPSVLSASGYYPPAPSSTTGYQTDQSGYDSVSSTPRQNNWLQPSSSNAGSSSSYNSTSSNTPQQSYDAGQASSSVVPTTGKLIKSTPGNTETLDAKFIHRNTSNLGADRSLDKVFKVLWSEPAGEAFSGETNVTKTDHTTLNGKVYTTIRRFIIVAADQGHCQCVPILTYQGRGTQKSGAKADEHAVVYIGNRPPEIVEEPPLKNKSIRIQPVSLREKLHPKSRVNYAKIYTVEHNVKVFFIGEIHRNSERTFREDFDAAWGRKTQINTS
ncbi:hypothetical protein G7Y89_g282 [Cudoniella acicularis]|uniref:DUF6590 domain-containing protein n=1 Tax=Cudoniella acicularis TaxID=354080 RepID=A0A8H4RXH2_9HELO|nr:hypothetical protein G7Y89_g282 [Cudoniella acicularis]